MSRVKTACLVAIAVACFQTSVSAITVCGTIWCAGTDANCGADVSPGPERLAGVVVEARESGVLVATTTTDENGRYCFSGADGISRTPFSVNVDPTSIPDKFLGSINCLNSNDHCPGFEHDTAICGDKDLAAGAILIDLSDVDLATESCRLTVDGIDFVFCNEPPPEPEGLCWMTGGGVKFDRTLSTWAAEVPRGRGPKDSVGGVVYPSCSSSPSNGGQWNHIAHSLKLHLIGQDIRVLRCGNVDGIEPGTESPVCGVNFIEFEGTGRLQGIGGNRMDPVEVTFFGRVQDHNEPGNEQSAKSGEDIDRYFLRVVDGDGAVRILVDEDGDPETVDPLTITGGNFQIHCTSCDDPTDGGGAALLGVERGRLPSDSPHEGGKLFVRGDSNFDGHVDVADPISSLDYLFLGGTAPICLDAADSNDDGFVGLSDAIQSLTFLFSGSSPMPAPYPEPWFDTTIDSLPCGL